MRKQIERLSNQPKGTARKWQVGIQGQIQHTSKPTLLPDSRRSMRQTHHTLRWSAEAQLSCSNKGHQPPLGSRPLCGGAAMRAPCPRGLLPSRGVRGHMPARQPQQERGGPRAGMSMLLAPENTIQTLHNGARPPSAFIRRTLSDPFVFLPAKCHSLLPPPNPTPGQSP